MTFGGQSRIEELLGRIELFSGLEPAALSKLAAHGEVVHVPGGETLMREGDASDALFVVASGRLQAFVDGGAGKTLVGEIGRGEVIGEMGNGLEQQADIVLHPDVAEFGLLAWERLDEIIEAGYRYAMKELPVHEDKLKSVL